MGTISLILACGIVFFYRVAAYERQRSELVQPHLQETPRFLEKRYVRRPVKRHELGVVRIMGHGPGRAECAHPPSPRPARLVFPDAAEYPA